VQPKRKREALALLMPLLPDREQAARAFLCELETTFRAELQRAGQRLGIEAAYWHLVELRAEPLLLVTLLGANPPLSLWRLSTSELPFDVWLREQTSALTGALADEPFPLAWRSEPIAGYRLGALLPAADWRFHTRD
jgi:hypothetical protein